MIRYDRLWNTMSAKGITQYRLIKQHNFSAGQIGRLKKNMHVSTHTLDTLCSLLECGIDDIVEYIPDQTEVIRPIPASPLVSATLPQQPPSNSPSHVSQDEKEKLSGSKQKKSEPSKNEKLKKAGKSKKSEKKASKNEKKGKEGKKNK